MHVLAGNPLLNVIFVLNPSGCVLTIFYSVLSHRVLDRMRILHMQQPLLHVHVSIFMVAYYTQRLKKNSFHNSVLLCMVVIHL